MEICRASSQEKKTKMGRRTTKLDIILKQNIEGETSSINVGG